MSLLDYTNAWVKGEVFQGKIMIIIGALLLLGMIVIFKGDNQILRGTLIPLSIVLLILFGYGGFQIGNRPSYMNKVSEIYSMDQQVAIDVEKNKTKKDDKTYKILKIVWGILIAVSAILYFIFSTAYLTGVSIGLLVLFLTTLTVDSILHHRLMIYMNQLKKLA